MNDEYILRIFWNRANEHEDYTNIKKRNFGVDIMSDVNDLIGIIEKLIEAFPILKKSNHADARFNEIKYYIEHQIKFVGKEFSTLS